MNIFVYLSLVLTVHLTSSTLLPLSGLFGLDEHEAGVFGLIASSPLQLCDLNTDTCKDVSQMSVHLYMPGDEIGRAYLIHEAAEKIISDPDFDKNLPIFMMCPGFNTKLTFNEMFIKGCNKIRCNHNIIILNHYTYTKSSFIELESFKKSCSYVDSIAKAIAEFLAKLIACGVCLDNFHCTGHSLGAHIIAVSGQKFTAITGQRIPRCTGLDPCGPCMNTAGNESRISSNDCKFVDCYFTNFGQMGSINVICDANFLANGKIATQPGCGDNDNLLKKLNPDMICSHLRSIYYYLESIDDADSCYACECPTWKDFQSGRCSSGRVVRAGHYTTSDVKGVYMYRTDSKAKFTLGRDGARPCKKRLPKEHILCPSLL